MTPGGLTHILQTKIPLSKAMGVRVLRVSPSRGVKFKLPLKPNRNHKNTAFGGTLVAGQALAAWSWLMSLLESYDLHAEVVVQRLQGEFYRPVDREFIIETQVVSRKDILQFIKTLRRKKRARIAISTFVRLGKQVVAKYSGEYVAIYV